MEIKSFSQELDPLNEQETENFMQNLVNMYGEYLFKLTDKNRIILSEGKHSFYDNENKYKLKIEIQSSNIKFIAILIGNPVSKELKSNPLFSLANNISDNRISGINLNNEIINKTVLSQKLNIEKENEKHESHLKKLNEIDEQIKRTLIDSSLSENIKKSMKYYEVCTSPELYDLLNDLIDEQSKKSEVITNNLRKLQEQHETATKKLQTIENNIKNLKDSFEETPTYSLIFEVDSTMFTSKKYNYYLRKNQRSTRFFIGANLMGNLSYRILSATGTVANSNDLIDERNENEFMLPNITGGFNLGFANNAHHFSLSYSYQKFGMLLSEYNKINPKTGYYSNTDQFDKQYSRVNLFGFQYEYSNYWRKWSPYFQAGIQVIFDDKGEQDLGNQRNNYFGTSIKSGIGLSYKPWYRAEFHVCPTGLILLNSAEATYVNTRYFALGLEFGVHVYMNKCLPKSKKSEVSK